MQHRARLLVAIASTLPLGLSIIVCWLLVTAGSAPSSVLSALATAVIAQGVFTYLRLRRTTPTTRLGRASAESTNP